MAEDLDSFWRLEPRLGTQTAPSDLAQLYFFIIFSFFNHISCFALSPLGRIFGLHLGLVLFYSSLYFFLVLLWDPLVPSVGSLGPYKVQAIF